jgi:hypothetical protein
MNLGSKALAINPKLFTCLQISLMHGMHKWQTIRSEVVQSLFPGFLFNDFLFSFQNSANRGLAVLVDFDLDHPSKAQTLYLYRILRIRELNTLYGSGH